MFIYRFDLIVDMKFAFIALIAIVLVLSGCATGNVVTGHITLEDDSLKYEAINACITACAKCNPKALETACTMNCNEIYTVGGILKVQKYTELYSSKCRDEVVNP